MLEEFREQADKTTNFEEDTVPPIIHTYREKRFMGMTAFQRFFILLMLFFIICLLGVFFLVVTRTIVPGFLVF